MNVLLANLSTVIIDVVAVCIILIYLVSGFIRGFIKTFLSTFGTVLSLLIAILLCTSVATFLQGKFGVVSALSNSLNSVFNNMFGEVVMNTPLEYATADTMSQAGVSGWIIQIVLIIKNSGNVSSTATLNQVVSPVFAYYIVLVLSVIVLFIIFKIIFYIIGDIISSSKKLVFVHKTDKLFGAILGLIKGVVVVEFIIMIVSIIPLGFCQSFIANLNQYPITNFLYSINLYNSLLSNLSLPNIISYITALISA